MLARLPSAGLLFEPDLPLSLKRGVAAVAAGRSVWLTAPPPLARSLPSTTHFQTSIPDPLETLWQPFLSRRASQRYSRTRHSQAARNTASREQLDAARTDAAPLQDRCQQGKDSLTES
jgi:hypothetical protein